MYKIPVDDLNTLFYTEGAKGKIQPVAATPQSFRS